MSAPTLHLLMGLPGAGKSTLALVLQEITNSARLSSDEIRLLLFPKPTFSQKEHDNLYALIDHSVEHLLAAGQSVIYDANLNRYKHRQEKYDLAKKYNARVRLWWVRTPAELAKSRRVAEQNDLLLPEGETAEKMFDRIKEVMERPRNSEEPIEVNGTKITTNYVKSFIHAPERKQPNIDTNNA